MRGIVGVMEATSMNLDRLQEEDGRTWHALVHGVTEN